MSASRSLYTLRAEQPGSDRAIYPDTGHFRILDATQTYLIGLGKLEASTDGADEAELGYMILPEYWGQGVASKVASILA